MFLGKWKDPWQGAKGHLCDHSNYVKTICELTQQSPNCTQTLEQQATGEMDEVGQKSEVAIELPYTSGLISDSIFVLWFYERFNFNKSSIHPFFALKITDAIILYAHEVLKIFNRHLNHKHEFTIITGKTLCDHF